ncbi:DUF1236 domain-containing protein [Salipiger bermudensis]|uniref:DUF1236 domain-containing protein n=1 Tax=Salipiger bermudensis TaxID=344736 RepID=UPI001C998C17|nr:DUF1236 domain-containing protein [Salipiger bermudensis]MBY6005781.1 DUF1236 domain-containing protein [Salipiger bermudensis]
MRLIKPAVFGSAILGILASPAMAAMTASTTTELNLRTGPGPQYEVAAVLPADAELDVQGCLEAADWCEVSYDGTSGWAYAAYMTTPVENEPVVIYENARTLEVETVTYEDDSDAVMGGAAGGAWGAAAGALLVGGPLAAATGAVIGLGLGANAEVEEKTVTYIRENPVEPVYLTGEVAKGAGIPQEVEIYTVPESNYAYVNVNRMPVVVDPESRRIVQVIR